MSHDPSEIILICWFAAEETCININAEKCCVEIVNIFSGFWCMPSVKWVHNILGSFVMYVTCFGSGETPRSGKKQRQWHAFPLGRRALLLHCLFHSGTLGDYRVALPVPGRVWCLHGMYSCFYAMTLLRTCDMSNISILHIKYIMCLISSFVFLRTCIIAAFQWTCSWPFQNVNICDSSSSSPLSPPGRKISYYMFYCETHWNTSNWP